jgi:hypothetical protein
MLRKNTLDIAGTVEENVRRTRESKWHAASAARHTTITVSAKTI